MKKTPKTLRTDPGPSAGLRFPLAVGFVLLFVSSLLVMPSSVLGQSLNVNRGPKVTGPYLAVAGGRTQYSQDFTYEEFGFTFEEHRDLTVSSSELRGGLDINRWFALEVRMGSGGGDHLQLGGDTDVSIDLDYYQNAFLKVKFPSYIEPYLLIGVTNVHANLCRENEGCHDRSEFQESTGLGVFFPIRGDYTTGLFVETVEYVGYENNYDNWDLEGFRLGLKIGF